MSTAAIIGGTAAAGLASSAIGAHAASSAANAGADAANHAADLERQSAKEALDFNKLQYGNSLNMLAPYYNTGTASLGRLGYLMGLSPNTGLPPGVVNPNAPTAAPTRTTQIPGGPSFAGSFGDPDVLPSIGPGGVINANRFNRFSLAQSPFQNPAGLAGTQTGTPATTAQATSGTQNFSGGPVVNPQNPDPNDPNGFGTGLGDPSPFGPGGLGDITNAGVNASTNAGGTGQVPRTDGGAPPSSTGAATPGGFGSLATNFGETWQAPTAVTEQNDPGYQFRLQQGLNAVQNSAAARGKLVAGDTAKALDQFAQGDASSEFQNVYNRSLNDYTTRYNAFNQDQNTLFNRFATLSGLGQTSAGQLSNAGLSTAGLNSNILLNSGQQIGQDLQNAGAARGSGYVGTANAITGGLNGVANIATLLALMKQNPSNANPGGIGV